jgi:maltose alpha-D-glucosyltransferase/alpha-amylase
MQWTADRHGGFSRARSIVRPAISDAVYGYRTVNVADQRRDPDSLLNWTERIIRTRKECQEISWGEFTVLRTNAPEVLALRYDWRGTSLLTLHNFVDRSLKVKLRVESARAQPLVEVFDRRHSLARPDGTHLISMEPYAWRWFRVGSSDNTLNRSDLSVTRELEVR